MTDAMHKHDEKGKARKAVRRARAPEVKTKYPPIRKRRGLFGIEYSYRFLRRALRPFRRWYATERGRDQAFTKMQQENSRWSVTPMYTVLEKVSR